MRNSIAGGPKDYVPRASSSLERLSVGQIAAFALPAGGLAALLFFVQFFFLKYGAEVLLIPPAVVGLILAGAKIWDAVSDPLVGSWSDRTRGPAGRRHPWMWGSLPVMGAGFVALWAIPTDLGLTAKVVLVVGALLVFYTGFTLHSVPHVSFGAEMSRDSHQRVRAFGARHVLWTLGLFAAFALVQAASGRSQQDVLQLSWAAAGVALLLCAVTPALLKPRQAAATEQSSGLAADYRAVLGQPGAATLFAVWFIENLGAGVLGGLAPFYADYVIGRPDLIGALPAVYAVAGVVSIPLWVIASRWFGAKPTWLFAMLLGAAGFALTYASTTSLVVLFVALGLAGAAMGCGGVMATAVMADLVDALHRRTGARREGAFTAFMNFALKTGIALSTALGGLMLSLAGFQANQAQSPQTVEAIRVFFAVLPAAGFLVGAALFARFPGRSTHRVALDAPLESF